MSLHIPFSAVSRVFGWLFDWLTKRLMLPTYRWSHERWERNHQLGAHWKSLGQYVEYSVRLAQLTDPEPRVSRIAFRAKEQELAKVDLVFEAIGSGIRYQEKISVDNLDQRPVVWALDKIPHDDLVETSDRGIYFKIDSYKIFNCNIQLPDGRTLRQPDSLRASLMHNWLLNDVWVTRWNHRWNCNAIRWAKNGIREYWHFGFGRPRVVVFSPLAMPSRRTPIWRSVAAIFGRLMGSKWLVTVQFWLGVWSGLCVLTDDERLQWRSKVQSDNQRNP